MAPRGRGGKFSKPSRGGGKKFSRDLQPLDKEGNPIGMWREPGEKAAAESSSEEESSEEETSEEDDDDAPGSSAAAGGDDGEVSREKRKEQARLKKQAAIAKKNQKTAAVGDLPTSSEDEDEDDEDDMPANPNHTQKARSQARAVTGPGGEDAPKKVDKENLSRREREAIAAQQAKERYQKLHAEGKTDEAKADLARLKLIREQRDAAAARKQAERDERDEIEKEKTARDEKRRLAAMGDAAKKPKPKK